MERKVRVTASVNVPDPLIEGFLQAISAMRAASVNTLSAYRQDLLDCQGQPMDIGGYYYPDPALAASSMRPSATFNNIISQFG